jgi:hypothetical protein
MTERFKLCIDIAAAVFILYLPFLTIWNHYSPVSPPGAPINIWVVLLIMDFLPCAFGMLWLIYRYQDKAITRFPIIKTYLNSPSYQAIGLLVAAVTALVLKYWR